MNLSASAPSRGRYIVEHAGQTRNDLTAAEVAELLEQASAREAKVYKVHNVYPDGRFELVGVPVERFQLEDGFFFYAANGDAARADFLTLCALAERVAPPCRAKVQLARLTGASPADLVALIYPAEYADEMSAWLSAGEYRGGERVEGGVSQVTAYYESPVEIIQRHQLWAAATSGSSAERAEGAA